MSTSGTINLTPRRRSYTLSLLIFGHGFAHWYNGILSVLYPAITVALGLTYSQVGLFDSSRGVIAVIVSLAGGYLADTLGHRRFFLGLCLVLLALFTALLGFANTFLAALVWLALGGIGNSLWHPYALPLLRQIYPKRKGLALSLHDAGANSFHGLAPIVVGLLLGLFSWQVVARFHLWPGLLMGGLIWFTMSKVDVTPAPKTAVNYQQALRVGVLRNRPFLMASAVSACLTMARLGLFTFLPLFLAFELGLDSRTQGLYMGVLTFSGALVAPGVGALADRVGVRKVLSVAISLACLIALALVSAESGVVLFIIIALLGSALFSTRSLILVYVLSVTPEEMGGSSVGTIFSLNRLFGTISPIIAGLIADTYSLRFVFYFFGALLLLGALLTLGLRKKN